MLAVDAVWLLAEAVDEPPALAVDAAFRLRGAAAGRQRQAGDGEDGEQSVQGTHGILQFV